MKTKLYSKSSSIIEHNGKFWNLKSIVNFKIGFYEIGEREYVKLDFPRTCGTDKYGYNIITSLEISDADTIAHIKSYFRIIEIPDENN